MRAEAISLRVTAEEAEDRLAKAHVEQAKAAQKVRVRTSSCPKHVIEAKGA
jgi:hypothetical protein